MDKLSRFGVSIEERLLNRFDKLVLRRGFPNRSKALSELIRAALVEEDWERGRQVAGALTIVYDHHTRDLNRRLTSLQHDFSDVIVSTMHVHMDHHHCLEVLAVRGPSEKIASLRDSLSAVRGVLQVRISAVSAGIEPFGPGEDHGKGGRK
jgi:CopG family nickel-responsive transcriptional regulator